MADFNLQPLSLLPQQSIQAPGLGKLGDIMSGANAINTQLQTGFNSDIKRQFANKVQAAIDGVPAYITDSQGNEVQNPAYVAALKPLALEAYHAQVQTGDNTLMDDLNTLIRTQQSTSGRGNIDWAAAQSVESQFNVFRTELEDLQSRKNSLTPAETVKYNELYNMYLGLDSQYNQITQGKRLQFKGRTDEYNANLGRMQTAQANKAEFDVKEQKSKAVQDATKYADAQTDKWINDKQEMIKQLSQVQKADAQVKAVPASNSPEALFTITKGLAGIIEPGLAVTEGEVNGFLGKNSVQQLLAQASNLKDMWDSFKKESTVQQLAYEAGNGSLEGTIKLKALADVLGRTLTKFWQDFINSGTKQFKETVAADIVRQFNYTVDDKVLNDIGTSFEQKFNARLPGAQPVTNIGSYSPAEATAKEELPKISPSDYERIMLKPTPDVSGDFMSAKQNSITWLTESLASFNTATDSKLRKRMLSAIKDVYGISERDYDMPADIDAAIKSLSLVDTKNPTTQRASDVNDQGIVMLDTKTNTPDKKGSGGKKVVSKTKKDPMGLGI